MLKFYVAIVALVKSEPYWNAIATMFLMLLGIKHPVSSVLKCHNFPFHFAHRSITHSPSSDYVIPNSSLLFPLLQKYYRGCFKKQRN